MTRRQNTTQRGYGNAHQKLRKQVEIAVDCGEACCARCAQPIRPGEPWHLDHDDDDRQAYIGPSHATCNTRAGAAKARRQKKAAPMPAVAEHPARWRSPDGRPWSRNWGEGRRSR